MNVLTDNYKLSQVATLNENGWPFCENDRPFWREYAYVMVGSYWLLFGKISRLAHSLLDWMKISLSPRLRLASHV
jgi:hypothetical protein